MKSQTIVLSSLTIVLCLLSIASLTPAVFASSSSFNGSPNSLQFPATTLPTYDVTLAANPSSFSVVQVANGIGGTCVYGGVSYSVCGAGNTSFTMTNKGTGTFVTSGKCTLTYTPGLNGKKSGKGSCGFIKKLKVKAGGSVGFEWTAFFYNWPSGTYKYTLTIDGKVGATKYQTMSGTYSIDVSGA